MYGGREGSNGRMEGRMCGRMRGGQQGRPLFEKERGQEDRPWYGRQKKEGGGKGLEWKEE